MYPKYLGVYAGASGFTLGVGPALPFDVNTSASLSLLPLLSCSSLSTSSPPPPLLLLSPVYCCCCRSLLLLYAIIELLLSRLGTGLGHKLSKRHKQMPELNLMPMNI